MALKSKVQSVVISWWRKNMNTSRGLNTFASNRILNSPSLVSLDFPEEWISTSTTCNAPSTNNLGKFINFSIQSCFYPFFSTITPSYVIYLCYCPGIRSLIPVIRGKENVSDITLFCLFNCFFIVKIIFCWNQFCLT